jgi:hypothetical protein
MDLQELKTKYPLLISYMEDHNYSWQYIRHIKNESLWILRESENHDWKTYDDIYQTCVEKYTNKNTLAYKRRILLVIKLFVLESVVPDGSTHVHIPSYYDDLCPDFKRFIDIYRNVIKAKYVQSLHIVFVVMFRLIYMHIKSGMQRLHTG